MTGSDEQEAQLGSYQENVDIIVDQVKAWVAEPEEEA